MGCVEVPGQQAASPALQKGFRLVKFDGQEEFVVAGVADRIGCVQSSTE
jgi:hypothetical protein